jgi:Na+/H+-dicarboxylate symporter
MTRTAVNVYSDSCAAVVIAKSEGETLKLQTPASQFLSRPRQ